MRKEDEEKVREELPDWDVKEKPNIWRKNCMMGHDGSDNNLKTSRKGASNSWSQQAPKNSKNHEAKSKKLEEVVIKEDHQR